MSRHSEIVWSLVVAAVIVPLYVQARLFVMAAPPLAGASTVGRQVAGGDGIGAAPQPVSPFGTAGPPVMTSLAPPSTMKTFNVVAGGDFQAALNTAQPGDTILLEPGATFVGNFVLPFKTGSGVITIRSSAADAALPGANVRIDPSYAPLLPKLRSPTTMAPLVTAAGAHDYTLVFLEFLGNPTAGGDLLDLGDGSTAQSSLAMVPHDLVVDRVYMHGDPLIGQKRAISLNSASTTIRNSYLGTIMSSGQDSQAIAGWNGPGPYAITNNYLEAAGENIIFGGDDPAIPLLVPSDITITGNHLSKQLSWQSQPFWNVKNLLEIKSAQRVLVTGNLLEYNWLAAQDGYAVLLTPRNQEGGAPWTIVQDVQFTNNIVRHVSSGINLLGTDNVNTSLDTAHIVIRNNLFEDVSSVNWGGYGRFLLVNGGSDITVDHNTIIQDGWSAVYADTNPTLGFVLTNNIMPDYSWIIIGTNTAPGNPTIAHYFPNSTILGGLFAGSNPARYPSGNFYPATMSDVGFLSLTGGDYQLAPSSPYVNAATDGTAVGCDFARLTTAIGSVSATATVASVPTGDFEGSGNTDLTVFRPSTGTWYIRDPGTGTTRGAQWGSSGDVPVPGDYDGDGKTDLAVFRPSNSTWYIVYSSTGTARGFQWGSNNDVPVPGDYDGDGRSDLAVFRPSNGTWYLWYSGGTTTVDIQWGNGNDVPVPGDYDGDGKTDVAVFRPSTGTWYVVYSSTGTAAGFHWGNGSDIPVPGDYDGDGKMDVAVFRPSNGTWYLWYSSTGTMAGVQWGSTGDVPVPGDYDGDGKTDLAIFRPSNGTWYLQYSSTGTTAGVQWGNGNDVPVLKAP